MKTLFLYISLLFVFLAQGQWTKKEVSGQTTYSYTVENGKLKNASTESAPLKVEVEITLEKRPTDLVDKESYIEDFVSKIKIGEREKEIIKKDSLIQEEIYNQYLLTRIPKIGSIKFKFFEYGVNQAFLWGWNDVVMVYKTTEGESIEYVDFGHPDQPSSKTFEIIFTYEQEITLALYSEIISNKPAMIVVNHYKDYFQFILPPFKPY
jgi:hypothetical protein